MKDFDVVAASMRLIKGYQKQAEEQALLLEKWRVKLAVMEGDLLKVIEADIDREILPSAMEDLLK